MLSRNEAPGLGARQTVQPSDERGSDAVRQRDSPGTARRRRGHRAKVKTLVYDPCCAFSAGTVRPHLDGSTRRATRAQAAARVDDDTTTAPDRLG
jgi:hypothetical protein